MSSTAILTIDDIASKNTPEIVDYLCEKQIQAVMFAVGENVEKFYDNAIYALQKGMIVGNHSYSHPHFSEISLEQGIEEIEKMEEVLNKLYRDAGVKRAYRPFRFPYGDKGNAEQGSREKYEALQDYLKGHGFSKLDDTKITYQWYKDSGFNQDVDTLWTFDFAEYQIREGSGFTEEDVFKRIYHANPENGGAILEDGSSHIVLLHAHDETEEIVPEYYKHFLNCCMEHGVHFVKPGFREM